MYCYRGISLDLFLFRFFFSSENRIRSTILGQRKPKTNKRKKKKRTTERRYSEGEASDYDENNTNNKSCGESDTNGEKNVIPDQRDSGVDFGGDSGDDNSKKSTQKNSKNNRSYKKANGSNKNDDNGLEMEFKSGMMFDFEM